MIDQLQATRGTTHALLILARALIETHPDRSALRRRFDCWAEKVTADLLNTSENEAALGALELQLSMLRALFQSPRG